MKTLKKTLCLVLAVVMVVGVLILPAYAADDYDDAIKALQTYGVLQGYPDGDLHKDANITRGQMAAIIYRIMTGDTSSTDAQVATKYGSYADRFTDANVAPWAKGYIGFCYNKGVLKGYDTGAVQPNKQINGYEVQAMLLRALGYDSNGEYTGSNWKYNVLSDATKSGISKNVSLDPANATPRGAVAQYTYDAAVNTDRVAPTLVPNVGYASIGMSLIEVGATSKDYDKFGAPSTIYDVTYTWPDYDVTTSPVVPDKAIKEYWTPVTQAAAYADAGLNGDKAKIDVYTNGKDNKESVELTATDTTPANAIGGQGRWTRIYSNRIVIVDTFLSEVTKITKEVKVNGEVAVKSSYNLETYYNDENPVLTGDIYAPAADELKYKVDGTTTFAKGDMLSSYAVADDTDFSGITKLSLDSAAKVATASVTVKAIVKNDKSNEITGFIGTDGKTYLYNYTYGYNGKSSTVELTEADIGKTFTLYLDAKGNVLGVEPAASESGSGYGVVLDVDAGKIKGGEYYAILTVLTKDNKQVKINVIDYAGDPTDVAQEPYKNESDAIDAVEALIGNLVSWTADKLSADEGYTGYSKITTPIATVEAVPDDKLEANDADALGTVAGKMLNDETVFFIANYKMQNSKKGYVFTNYTVVTGFQNIQDLSYTAGSNIVDNPNEAADDTKLEYQYLPDSDSDPEWAKAVLVISAVNKSSDTVVPVSNYAFLTDPNAFVDVYDDYYEYNAVINGKADQGLRVNYVATSAIDQVGLYTYSEYTNEGWKDVKLALGNTMDGNDYTYNAGVLYQGTGDAETGTNFYAVGKDVAIYLVNPETRTSTKVDVDLDVVQDVYGAAANKIWFQTNKYGVIDMIYVEIPEAGSANPGIVPLEKVSVTLTGTTEPNVGDYVSDYGIDDDVTITGTANPAKYGAFGGKITAKLTWLKMNSAGEYVTYTGTAFTSGQYRVQITLTLKNASNEYYSIGKTTSIEILGNTAIAGDFDSPTNAKITSNVINVG